MCLTRRFEMGTSPGSEANKRQKLEIAHPLAKLGVDVIEAGFPCSSPRTSRRSRLLPKRCGGPVIAGLARAVQRTSISPGRGYRKRKDPNSRIPGASDIHLQKKLRRIARPPSSGQHKRASCQTLLPWMWSIHGALRSDFDYLCQMVRSQFAPELP